MAHPTTPVGGQSTSETQIEIVRQKKTVSFVANRSLSRNQTEESRS